MGGPDNVEAAAEWPGEDGVFFAALRDCRLIDEREDGAWEIHDYWHHCPDYVPDRAAKEAEREKDKHCDHCGKVYHSPETNSMYCSNACKQAAYRLRKHEGVTDRYGGLRNGDHHAGNGDDGARHCDGGVTGSDAPPAPAPAPAPIDTPAGAGEAATPQAAPPITPDEFMAAWNAKVVLTPCRKMTNSRKKALRTRLADPTWASSWRDALNRAATSPFCRGENDRRWKANVEWFLRPDTVTRILEGQYDDNARTNGHARGGHGGGMGRNRSRVYAEPGAYDHVPRFVASESAAGSAAEGSASAGGLPTAGHDRPNAPNGDGGFGSR
jgi:hypothetical protein